MSGLGIGRGTVEFCKGCMFDGWCKRKNCKSLHNSQQIETSLFPTPPSPFRPNSGWDESEQMKAFRERLERINKRVPCECKIDPEIIGGWRMQDGQMICNSCQGVRGREEKNEEFDPEDIHTLTSTDQKINLLAEVIIEILSSYRVGAARVNEIKDEFRRLRMIPEFKGRKPRNGESPPSD